MRDRSDYWRERSAQRRQDPAYRAKQAEWNKAWHQANGNTPERLARKAEQMRAYAKALRSYARKCMDEIGGKGQA